MGETAEKTKPIDVLSYVESKATKLIADSMKKDPKKTIELINKMLVQVQKAPETKATVAMKKKLIQKKTAIEGLLDTKKYLQTVTTTFSSFTDRPKKIPYGQWPGKLVCDQFVKAVLTRVEKNQDNKDTINSVYGTVNMFNKIQPTKTLSFNDGNLSKVPPVGALLFFVKGNKCSHVGFFAWLENGVPLIADANNNWVTKRKLMPTEASKFYYEENYREKFLKKA